MLHALTVLAAEGHEPSKTAFYIVGGALAAFAVLLAGFGLSRAGWPGSVAVQRGVTLLTVALVAAAMVTTIVTA